ncbi:uncharacterized protein LOC124228990 [Equus quagga]|uniref:uncharacterized protein LOC124228990 n=1 Tax=Equus quagga TaxID=89248 RepID=UPI001EE38C45|nr:uncharacterized protein LOC124228990 [Equus quagga]
MEDPERTRGAGIPATRIPPRRSGAILRPFLRPLADSPETTTPSSRRLNSAQREAVAPPRFPGARTGVCGRLGRRGGGLRGGGQAALPPGTSAPKFSSASGRPRSRGLGVPRPRRPGRPGLARPCWAPARTAPSLRASACHPRPRACAPRQIWDGVGLLGATNAPFPGDVTQAELFHHLPDDPCSRPEALLFLSVLSLQLAPIPLAAAHTTVGTSLCMLHMCASILLISVARRVHMGGGFVIH